MARIAGCLALCATVGGATPGGAAPEGGTPGGETALSATGTSDREVFEPPLSEEHARWLRDAGILLTAEERSFFGTLSEEFRRAAFIEAFWASRDPDPRTRTNELRRSWEERVNLAVLDYGSTDDDRARALLFNGEPGGFVLRDGREIERCWDRDVELEIWFYARRKKTSWNGCPEDARDLSPDRGGPAIPLPPRLPVQQLAGSGELPPGGRRGRGPRPTGSKAGGEGAQRLLPVA